MRRADRLFQIVQILRNRSLVTAHSLAERLEVSERTIYRDIRDLSLSGVPIESEAGVGYCLRHSLDIPPLMFTQEEIEALVVGARMVKAWGGHDLGQAAQSVLDKVEAVLPNELKDKIEQTPLFALRFETRDDLEETLDICRSALHQHRFVQIDYQALNKQYTQRRIKPLGLYFWGHVWTLVAWCELRQDFRSFRLDRMQTFKVLDETFEDRPGQRLDDFVADMHSRFCQTK